MPRQQPKIITILLIAAALFSLGKIIENKLGYENTYRYDRNTIQQITLEKQADIKTELKKVRNHNFADEFRTWTLMDSLSAFDIHYFLFKDSAAIAWSTNSIPLQTLSLTDKSIVKLLNGWYLIDSVECHPYTLIGLSLIKEKYAYQNKFLATKFVKDFSITHQPDISTDTPNSIFTINDINGNYLMSLEFKNNHSVAPVNIIAFIINIIAFILLILIAIRILERYKEKGWINYLLIPTFIYLLILSLSFNRLAIPYDFKHLNLFSPITFAVSEWLPSLGCLFFFGIFLVVFSYIFYRYYKTPEIFLNKNTTKKRIYLVVSLSLLFIIAIFILTNDLIHLVVLNSSQASIFFNIEDLNTVALFKILILILFYISAIFIYKRIISSISNKVSLFKIIILATINFLILFALRYIFNQTLHLIDLAFFLIMGVILYKVSHAQSKGFTFSSLILVVFTTSFYVIYLLYTYNIEKEENNREIIIENLSFRLSREADSVAEMYLSEIDKKIKKDKTLINILLDDPDNESAIDEHLQKKYFYGYWKRYDLETVVCWHDANLFIESENRTTNCYNYFDDLIQENGQLVDGCENFYFLDNSNEQVSYFGRIPFLQDEKTLEITLFCEINSKPIFSGLGYPELLKNQQEQTNQGLLKNYSFAKYNNSKLVKQYGNYHYPMSDIYYTCECHKKSEIKNGQMTHLIYKPDKNSTIVLSRPEIKIIYLLMSFSTFSLLFFLIASVFIVLTRTNKKTLAFTIQERIQISFVSLMVIILLVMGVSSVFYSIYQFKQKNNQMLSQRIKSVLQEMEQKIVNEDELNYEMHDYLQYLMQKFSNVFYSDINLYQTNGELLATSRPELYQKGLTGKKMNPRAFYKLTFEKKAEFIHEEYIGNLRFTSAYVPIYNYRNEVLAYLNLPYVIGNNELKSEISSVIVAVINAYLLFILFAIGLAVIISRHITRPLMLIQNRLAQIRIDKLNKKIGYKGNDEIGNLVKEYNRMVDEISESAEKLAKTERETAWREMAKQVAHEIKNPLTPMRLSVQYLIKAWDNKQEDFDSFIKRVSKTLIEQIDQLHIIANEFSDFAKMPQAKRSKVDIIEKLKNTVALFEKAEPNMRFSTNIDDSKRFIFVDPDQMVSVLNNIIKNAVQAIPNDRQGIINISSKVVDQNIHITISDNGRGITDEVKNKIFMPNFTTKSSGMGLGLAIVKNIVNSSGGEIWFETTEDIGTTFYIQFPVYERK